ncbi:HD domain-containing protein [Nocardia sp. NPDC056000]|uniref:HD domain-containing protein n=1 Tax=Nocardia sp. NPDC056000 TaxID=3345674 RepID=UPI0035DF1639
MENDSRSDAQAFAAKAHGGQLYGVRPYTYHLAAVGAVLREFGVTDPEFGAAAWLHDVVEDTGVGIEEVEAEFGVRVAGLVWAVTGVGETRKERNVNAYGKIRATPEAVKLKLADRISNVRASVASEPRLLEMYRGEYAGFREQLHGLLAEDPVVREMWGRLDELLGWTD